MATGRPATTETEAVNFLRKAAGASSAGLRAKYATRGLAHGSPDATTQALLLRQLYLAHMEAERFEDALQVAQQMVKTRVMSEVARQDAARACLGLGRIDDAVSNLRIASREGPASRRAFHLWTLGSTLYLHGRAREAAGALSRAARWGTTAKPLYLAQAALARRAAGDKVRNLRALRDQLSDAPCGQGYGQFVLGEMAFHLGDFAESRRCLDGFLQRSSSGRVALAVTLSAEIREAARLLEMLRKR